MRIRLHTSRSLEPDCPVLPSSVACAFPRRVASRSRPRAHTALTRRAITSNDLGGVSGSRCRRHGIGDNRAAISGYLERGILLHDFALARCADFGHDFLVAYSCRGRGICSRCITRHTVETAARLTDHVSPHPTSSSISAPLGGRPRSALRTKATHEHTLRAKVPEEA